MGPRVKPEEEGWGDCFILLDMDECYYFLVASCSMRVSLAVYSSKAA